MPREYSRITSSTQIKISISDAVDCLNSYLDCDLGNLEDLLDLADQEDAIDDVCRLSRIHLDSECDTHEAVSELKVARSCMKRLLDVLQCVPRDDPCATTSYTVFDKWLDSAESLLQEMLAIIDRAFTLHKS